MRYIDTSASTATSSASNPAYDFSYNVGVFQPSYAQSSASSTQPALASSAATTPITVSATAGKSFSVPVQITSPNNDLGSAVLDGTQPSGITWSCSGSSCTLGGNVAQAATYPFTIKMTNNSGVTSTQAVSLVVKSPSTLVWVDNWGSKLSSLPANFGGQSNNLTYVSYASNAITAKYASTSTVSTAYGNGNSTMDITNRYLFNVVGETYVGIQNTGSTDQYASLQMQSNEGTSSVYLIPLTNKNQNITGTDGGSCATMEVPAKKICYYDMVLIATADGMHSGTVASSDSDPAPLSYAASTSNAFTETAWSALSWNAAYVAGNGSRPISLVFGTTVNRIKVSSNLSGNASPYPNPYYNSLYTDNTQGYPETFVGQVGVPSPTLVFYITNINANTRNITFSNLPAGYTAQCGAYNGLMVDPNAPSSSSSSGASNGIQLVPNYTGPGNTTMCTVSGTASGPGNNMGTITTTTDTQSVVTGYLQWYVH